MVCCAQPLDSLDSSYCLSSFAKRFFKDVLPLRNTDVNTERKGQEIDSIEAEMTAINVLTVSIVTFFCHLFLLSVGTVVSQNITSDITSNNPSDNRNTNNTFIHNYLNRFQVNKSFDDSFASNNRFFSELVLNKSSDEMQSNSSLFVTEFLKQMAKNEPNVSLSESRTLSSWLGLDRLRRPHLKLKPFPSSPVRAQSQAVNPLIAPQLPFPQFLSRPNSFPGPHDPESIILPPSLFEDSGIKYWLKFIENAGKDEMPESDDPSEYDLPPLPKPPSGFRPRKPAARKPYSSPKPIDIGEKPNDENTSFYDDSEESDDQNEEEEDDKRKVEDEPKSSGTSPSSHNKQTFDTSPRCDKFTSDICVDDFEYPEQAIVDEIYKRRELFELMYSEVRDNVPLVDGIPRDVEESYNYDYYDDNKDPQTSSSGAGSPEKKSNPGRGFVCPTEVMYGKPKLARNKRGDWKVIVNAAEFTQTVRMEKCLKPNSKCNFIAYADFDSRCAQVHSFHRLLVFEKGKGFYIDTFRMPTACTCHVTRRVSYKPVSNPPNRPQKRKPQPSQPLSNTLWSILGGPLPSEGSSISPSQEMVRNQINLLQQIKHFPQLSHISPDNVFQQLMDLQSTSDDLVMPQKSFSSSQKQNPLSFGQSGIDYILPSYMLNDDQSGGGRKPQSQMSRPLAQIHQSSGTTTLLNPNGNGAPVVQVIHVPVTSGVSSMSPHSEPVPVYKSKPNPPFNDYSYLDTSSLFLKPKPTSDEFLQTFGDEFSQLSVNNFKPLMLGMSSKTNSSLMSPKDKDSDKEHNIRRESESVDTKTSDSDETNQKRKVMVESSLNKKINFSYHPILEYISA